MTGPVALTRERSPAHFLAGAVVDGWTVVERLSHEFQTGAFFSVPYRVERDGRAAFLKAIDLSRALGAPDPTDELSRLTGAFNHERDLVASCRSMDRVVRGIAAGTVPADATTLVPVPYIVFEFADSGDVRRFMNLSDRFDVAWCLRSLHHLAVGTRQLHRAGVAHQDLKPSNTMVFNGATTKIGDLGVASSRVSAGPRDGLPVPGDLGYAPIEFLYGRTAVLPEDRQIGDLYLLGSMVLFYFLGLSATALIEAGLQPVHHWTVWGGTFNDVLPFLRSSLGVALKQLEGSVPTAIAVEVSQIARDLCDPDPTYRGGSRGIGPHQTLERVISRLNALATRAEIGMVTGL